MRITGQEFTKLFNFAFSNKNPGYKNNVVESPHGDGVFDVDKKYAHIAPKYIEHLPNTHYTKQIYEKARLHACDVCDKIGISKEYYPGYDSTLRILYYPPGATTAPHTDFNLFTLCMYRNVNDTFVYLSGDDNDALKRAKSISPGIHFGELMTEIYSIQPTKHKVVESFNDQFSAVFFVIPDHKVLLPSGKTVGEWITERKDKSRKTLDK